MVIKTIKNVMMFGFRLQHQCSCMPQTFGSAFQSAATKTAVLNLTQI